MANNFQNQGKLGATVGTYTHGVVDGNIDSLKGQMESIMQENPQLKKQAMKLSGLELEVIDNMQLEDIEEPFD